MSSPLSLINKADYSEFFRFRQFFFKKCRNPWKNTVLLPYRIPFRRRYGIIQSSLIPGLIAIILTALSIITKQFQYILQLIFRPFAHRTHCAQLINASQFFSLCIYRHHDSPSPFDLPSRHSSKYTTGKSSETVLTFANKTMCLAESTPDSSGPQSQLQMFQPIFQNAPGTGHIDPLESFPSMTKNAATVQPEIPLLHNGPIQLFCRQSGSRTVQPQEIGALRLNQANLRQLPFQKLPGTPDIFFQITQQCAEPAGAVLIGRFCGKKAQCIGLL